MKIGMFGLIGAAALATAANANFDGWVTEVITLGNGNKVMNIYAHFTHANDRVLNAYNATITTSAAGGFFHSGANPFWKPGTTENKNTSDDSWVTIGTNPTGNGNAGGAIGGVGANVTGDPNFVNFDDSNGSSDFSIVEGLGTGAGWYNGNPVNAYGYAFDQNRVLLMHADLGAGNEVLAHINWNVTLTVFLNGATTSTSGIGTGNNVFTVPAPGALALLSLAGLTSRRRRA